MKGSEIMKTPSIILNNFKRRDNKGIAFVYIALLLFALVGFVAIAIDLGYMYTSKTQLQNSADSASLAGAALLDGTNSTEQTAARNAALDFAGKNQVAGNSFQIASDATNTLSNDNDITVGNWNATKDPKYKASRLPINAVEVRARRTLNSPAGPISTFFGRVFTINTVNVSSIAVAEWQGLASPGFVLCSKSCVPGREGWFILQENSPPGSDYTIAWSEYKPVSSVDSNTIKDLINGTIKPSFTNDICPPNSKCITTTNATSPINYLDEKFRDPSFDAIHKEIENGVVKKWWVLIPLVNYDCNTGPTDPNEGCPPSKQGSNQEPYHVNGWMKTAITNTRLTGSDKGIYLQEMSCALCPEPNPWVTIQRPYLHPILRK